MMKTIKSKITVEELMKTVNESVHIEEIYIWDTSYVRLTIPPYLMICDPKNEKDKHFPCRHLVYCRNKEINPEHPIAEEYRKNINNVEKDEEKALKKKFTHVNVECVRILNRMRTE